MSLNFPVTLVIPILNEAESLPELLQALKAQSHRPDEIIFSDAGSSDGSPALIEDWWREEGWENASCSVLSRPGAMPGAGRNAGVRAARNAWIAFIDGGITPASDWLEQLCRHAQSTQAPAVFGVCHFSAQASFDRAVCALSYGQGAAHPVIPASLFSRQVFTEIGEFPAHLRAGEDLVWMAALQARYGEREVCSAARVGYTHFPTGWRQALRKWRVTELHCVLAGVRTGQQAVYLFGLPLLCAVVADGGQVGAAVFLAYLLLRGVIDPIRRSLDRPWWGHRPWAALIALPLVAALDIAKWTGIVQGLGVRLSTRISFGRGRHADL
ncbi:glycosyltransferase family A protein [uncultured Propionivibrio sp.]|uniref:glycosyltransferase family 2 protein n=1 Tax=uncultured Propionivibrio sp. TaxID=426737 RepID=UPI0029C0661E|nr:glycosyltransferase family A protein [uncultured Propionivibrio sp.]